MITIGDTQNMPSLEHLKLYEQGDILVNIADAGSFAAALAAGDHTACLDWVRRTDAQGADARHICQLSEALFHAGRRMEALECARRALRSDANGEPTLDLCAWVFSNSGCHAEAADVYERLVARRPDWIEGHRHASGSYAAAGDLDRAIAHGALASDLAPRCGESALHAGSVLLAAGRCDEAMRYLDRAAAAAPQDARVWRLLSAAALVLDRQDDALAYALRALAFAPQDRDTMVHATEILLRAGQPDRAVLVAREAALLFPRDAAVLRELSAAEAGCECLPAALSAIEDALALQPDNSDYHLHRGHLLYRLGDFDAAATTFSCAAGLDGSSPAARRSQVAAYLAGGRLSEAIAAGGALLQAHAHDEASAHTVLHALNRHLDFLDTGGTILSTRPRHRRPRPPPGFAEGLRRQGRVIHALIIRETRTRFGDARLGYGWALLEPILHIMLLWVVFSLIMHGRPPIGREFIIFYYSGLVPYYMFIHTSSTMTYSVPSNAALLQLPLVTTFDVILARGILELITDVIVAVILISSFALIGLDATPHGLAAPAAALLVSAALGCGMGFINSVIQVFFRSWDKVWTHFTRVLYFASGIFYEPAQVGS